MNVLGGVCFYDGEVPAAAGGCECVNAGFYAYRTTNQTLSTVEAQVAFPSVRNDPTGMFSTITNLATIPYTGRWGFTANIEITVAARANTYLRFYRNGVPPAPGGTFQGSGSDELSIAGTATPHMSLVDWFTAGETLEVYAYQNSGSTSTIVGCCSQPWFSGGLIYLNQ